MTHKLQVAQLQKLLEVEEDPVHVLILVRREVKELVWVLDMVVVPVVVEERVEVKEVVLTC